VDVAPTPAIVAAFSPAMAAALTPAAARALSPAAVAGLSEVAAAVVVLKRDLGSADSEDETDDIPRLSREDKELLSLTDPSADAIAPDADSLCEVAAAASTTSHSLLSSFYSF